jgi:hemolysin D
VVPDDAPMLVEASVENGDIGFVRAGQDVEVQVETFTFTRYGMLHGHVVDVSRDRVDEIPAPGSRQTVPEKPWDRMAEDGEAKGPGYVAHVALDRTTLPVDGREETLAPGMAVTAEIKTGSRRVISYLLSPLRPYAHEGGTER